MYWQHLTCAPHGNCFSWHPKDSGGFFILRNRERPGIEHASQPTRAIIAHAGQDHTNRPRAIVPGYRIQQHIT
jgi:hypothetical protein